MTVNTHDVRGKSANGLGGKDCILIKLTNLAADLKFQRTGLGLIHRSHGEEFQLDWTLLSMHEGQSKKTWEGQKTP